MEKKNNPNRFATLKQKKLLLTISFLIFVVVVAFTNKTSLKIHADAETLPPAIISYKIPSDVSIPDSFSGNPIAYFDDFSWRSFIALVWPAKYGQRGVADSTTGITGNGPLVFETFKSLGEIFHKDGSAPSPWNQYDNINPCNEQTSFGNIVLASYSKFSNLGQAGFGKLVGPLVAQNKTYVRYLISFNQIEFDKIFGDTLYLRKNLDGKKIIFSNGALDTKSSWIDMTGVTNTKRYYTKLATVMDPVTGSCSLMLVGLVGLHIVQKTPSRPQWIWSTFEQIDNIPQDNAEAPYAFNNGNKKVKMPSSNPFSIDSPAINNPTPFNIERLKPIHPSTQKTNALYQDELKKQNSVWQYYQLVMTQWPKIANSPNLPGTPVNTFPDTAARTAFSNITMETFEQKNIVTGCMNCHNAPKNTDFLWALNNHAYSPNIPDFLSKDTAIISLKNILLNK